jgi:hypothetical protein
MKEDVVAGTPGWHSALRENRILYSCSNRLPSLCMCVVCVVCVVCCVCGVWCGCVVWCVCDVVCVVWCVVLYFVCCVYR